MGRLTARECLAVLEERINNLIDRFDKFEEAQQKLVEQVINNSRSINDLSHAVRDLMEERKRREEFSMRWRLILISTTFTIAVYILRDLIMYVLRVVG